MPGLCAMLQTIYETESCFSSDSVSSREQSLELLSKARVSTMPSTGEPQSKRGIMCNGGGWLVVVVVVVVAAVSQSVN